MKYFFILGKNPILSKAEIEAVLEFKECRIKNIEFSEKVLIIETEKKLDVDWLNNHLGGTVKIGKILDTISDLENFEEKFFDLIKFGEGKVYFGFSLYQLEPKVHLKHLVKKLTPLAMEIKRLLHEKKNINSRYVVSKELELSSVIVKKNRLLTNGTEICFLVKEKEILIGQTLAVQPFEEFGARDYARPSRDEISGMLPPKLARIMINLAQVKEDAQILDPFCGSGTILQEALLMGYENIIGFDKSAKAVADSKSNLAWLKDKYNVNLSKVKIKQLDVLKLSQQLVKNSVEAIITEPYLGPPLKGKESLAQIKKISSELEKLYGGALQEFYRVLKKNGRVVMVIPLFIFNNKIETKPDLTKSIKKIGWQIENKKRLIYRRTKQVIWREILLLKKK